MSDFVEHDGQMPAVVVLIVNYRSAAALERCLESLAREPVARVAVLENGTSESEWRALEGIAARHTGVELFRSEQNLGFGGGVNRLVELVEPQPHDILWLLNPDTVVALGTTMALTRRVTSDGYAVVTPRILTGEGALWLDSGELDRSRGRTWERSRSDTPAAEGMVPADYVPGAAMMLRATTFKKVGGFDPRLFLYWEDVDLSLRLRTFGVSLGVDHRCTIWHQEGASSKDLPSTRAMVFFYVSRNRILVCRAAQSRGLGLVIGVGAPTFVRLAMHAFLRGGRGRARRLLAVLRGAVAGLRMRDFVPHGALSGSADSSNGDVA